MAKIIYFISPFDESKKTEIISKGTLRYAMRELGIEHDPVAVIINGMNPDEVDMDMVLDDTDIVEIRRVVNGGGKSENKSIAATVIQIVAVVAATVVGQPWVAAAILAGGAVAAGALNKWAADLAAAENATDETKVDVSANNYSLTTANNQARQLRPIPVICGSHRLAPDIHTDVYRTRYGVQLTFAYSQPLQAGLTVGLVQSNGPMAAINSWATMPANYIATGLPKYPIKIAPYGYVRHTNTLTTAENLDIINDVRDRYKGSTGYNWFNKFMDYDIAPPPRESYPTVIYHFDPADPYRGRFNFMWCLYRLEQATGLYGVSNRYEVGMNNIFNGVQAGTAKSLFSQNFESYTAATWLLRISTLSTNSYFSQIPYNLSTASCFANFGEILLSLLNSGSYTTTNKTTSPTIPYWVFDFAPTSVKEGVPFGTQLFNFGFGDLSISDRKVGTMDILAGSGTSAASSPINKTVGDSLSRWNVPSIFGVSAGIAEFYNTVFTHQSKDLINPDVFNGLVSVSNFNPYNWSYFKGKKGQTRMTFALEGQVYHATGSGIGSNTTRLQLHWKFESEAIWNEYEYPVMTITNSKTNRIYIPFGLNPPIPMADIDNPVLSVRIRKVTLDADDNENNKISNLKITDICFFTPNIPPSYAENHLNAPMNLEGLYLTATVSDTSSSNRFSALVQSKCWVYNFGTETWSWTFNRNPAFWFLYYARGGFYNFQSMGSYSPPYSPTYGWQNYPGHPNNTSHIFGGGYTDDKLDMDKILEWAFFCEENNLKLDLVLKDEESVADTLEKIANVGRASVSYYGGTLSVVFEDPEQVPVCMFGMGNILAGSFAVDYSVGDPVRRVKAQFVNRENWETEEVEALVPFSDPEIVKEIEMTLVGITEKTQAQREVNILAARQYYQKRTYTFRVDWEGLLARRGDLAFLSHDSTQYGYSGRVTQFVVESGVVIGIKSGAIVDTDISYVSVYSPNGSIDTYTCELDGDMIRFTETYPIEKAPFYVNLNDENTDSDFVKSIAEDFHFIADIKETTGKKVRISSIEVDSDYVFTITAVDEDPAMWAYEYGDPVTSTSFGDSVVTLEVVNLRSLDLGQGKIRLLWDMNGGDFAQVVNLNTGLPLEANGQYSFSEGDVIFELTSGMQYELEVLPMTIGTPYKSISQKVKVWPL